MKIHSEKNIFEEIEKEYLEVINKTEADQKLGIVRLCFHRMPGSAALLERLWMYLRSEITGSIPAAAKRERIKEIDRAINRYQLQCNIHELDKAQPVSDDVEVMSDAILKELTLEEQRYISALVEQLTEKIEKLSDAPENQALLQEIEKLDITLNKSRLGQHPALKQKYEKCSRELLKLFNDKSDDKKVKKEKEYNQRAIDAHRKAYEIFNEKNILNELKEKGGTFKADFTDFVKKNASSSKFQTLDEMKRTWDQMDAQKSFDYIKDKGRTFKENAEGIINKRRNVEVEIKVDQDVETYVELMGGWNHQHLFPSTLIYTNSIYTRIFSKLNFQEQLLMTKLMVDVEEKIL